MKHTLHDIWSLFSAPFSAGGLIILFYFEGEKSIK